MVEVMDDRVFAVPPFNADEAARLIDRLKIARLLAGVRGAPASDIDALAVALSRFSVLVSSLASQLAEVDINPVIVTPKGCLAVDALVVGK